MVRNGLSQDQLQIAAMNDEKGRSVTAPRRFTERQSREHTTVRPAPDAQSFRRDRPALDGMGQPEAVGDPGGIWGELQTGPGLFESGTALQNLYFMSVLRQGQRRRKAGN